MSLRWRWDYCYHCDIDHNFQFKEIGQNLLSGPDKPCPKCNVNRGWSVWDNSEIGIIMSIEERIFD